MPLNVVDHKQRTFGQCDLVHLDIRIFLLPLMEGALHAMIGVGVVTYPVINDYNAPDLKALRNKIKYWGAGFINITIDIGHSDLAVFKYLAGKICGQ